MDEDPAVFVRRYFPLCGEPEVYICPEQFEPCPGLISMMKESRGLMMTEDKKTLALLRKTKIDSDMFFAGPHEFIRYHREGVFDLKWLREWKNRLKPVKKGQGELF